MTIQNKLLEDIEPVVLEKRLQCKYHGWAIRPEDWIQTLIKKTGKTIIRCRYCERQKQDNKKISITQLEREKKELTDGYIIKTLRRGKDGLKKVKTNEIPSILIEAKRAVIRLKTTTQELQQPLKICAKHGKLFREDVIKGGKNRSGTDSWKCRQCMKDFHAKNYQMNKDLIIARHRSTRISHPEKTREIRRKSFLKKEREYKEKARLRWEAWEKKYPEKAKKRNDNFKKKSIETLSDSYVKQSLLRSTGLKSENLPNNFIDAKRAIMMLKRGVKLNTEQYKILNFKQEKINDRTKN